MSKLSICVPAYGRPKQLQLCLFRFISQILGRFERDVEIIVVDDATPDDGLSGVRRTLARYPFVRFVRLEQNIGLERNLIHCTSYAQNEFVWIFGDDDFLEASDCLEDIMTALGAGRHDHVVLNRTRRDFGLTSDLSRNWMKTAAERPVDYQGLREFCLEWGLISVIGFISVNIFRRQPFHAVDIAPYHGTMYPQLGAMVEAFHDRPTLLLARPLVCHRTQTPAEKRAALGAKASEADFMADERRRNGVYFSHPLARMLLTLIERGGLAPADLVQIRETTVINGRLIDFVLQNIEISKDFASKFTDEDWARTGALLEALPLDSETRARARVAVDPKRRGAAAPAGAGPAETLTRIPRTPVRTISVVTPSFNQAEFLRECLDSVQAQTLGPLEHFVFDPGSSDGSREIAAGYPGVTLVAEPDKGQADAVNRGFQRATGDVIAWLNSDDKFADAGVFARVIERFNAPDAPDIVYGKGIFVDADGKFLRDVYVNRKPETLPTRFQHEDGILQPAVFLRRSVIERVGLLRDDNHFSMDYEYWIRCVKAGLAFTFMDDVLAVARYHPSNKTFGLRGKSFAEVCGVMLEHFGYVHSIWLRRYAEYLAEGFDGVLSNAANKAVQDSARLEASYYDLMRSYNCTYDVYATIVGKSSEPGYRETLAELKRLGLGAATPCKPVPLDTPSLKDHVLYTVGPRRWAFDAAWKQGEIARSHAFLRKQIAERTSDTVVIVGNGPSLNLSNLDLLAGTDVIISNNAFLSDKLKSLATYFTVVNYLVAEQSAHHINRLRSVHKVLPYWLAYTLNSDEATYFVDAVGHAAFSTDMFKNMSWRHTVTFFNFHLAYGLGYRTVVMIGFDHSYKQASTAKEQDIILSEEDDENHFHAAYFKRKKWQAADVDMMEDMYRLAKTAFEADGRRIINATEGGKLELFERVPLAEALAAR